MSSSAARSLAAQGVIGLALCLGGYASVVVPLRERLGAARADLASAEARAEEARAVEASMASVMDRLSRAQRQASEVSEAGRMARSQEALYASINARASGLGVRIDEFAPVDPGPARGGAGPDRGSAAGDVVLRCRFAATGTYGKLARLLRAISEENGFSAIRSVRLNAGSTGDEVYAEVETEHYSPDPTPRTRPGSAGEEHP
jgi:hypothetical protein